MAEQIQVLKKHLERITFTQVKTVIAKDENVFSFDKDGVTFWDFDPGFAEALAELTPTERQNAELAYHHYFGFTFLGELYFQMKDRVDDENYACLGVRTTQAKIYPPKYGDWIVGKVVPARKGCKFSSWSVCTEQERNFANFFLAKRPLPSDRRELSLQLSIGTRSNRLLFMAILLIEKNLQYFLNLRKQSKADSVDSEVFQICREFEPALWEQYTTRCHEQRIYSSLVKVPAPKPITDRPTGYEPVVGLSTPFAGLNL